MNDVPGLEGRYAVTSDGRVWSHPKASSPRGGRPHSGMWIKPQTTRAGYLSVDLKSGGRQLVHRLVLLAFVGPPPEGLPEANHKNGKKQDNHAGNLEWVSSSGNRAHAWRTGLIRQTEGRQDAAHRRALPLRKLDDTQAQTIRTRAAAGISKAALAREFSVSRKAIGNIVAGRTYVRQANQ